MDQRRLGISDIVIGHPLPWDVFGADRKLLLRKGHIVESAHQVAELLERGLFIDAHQTAVHQRSEEAISTQEAPSVLRLINSANKRLERLLYGLAIEPDARARILDIAQTLVSAVELNRDIALGCIFLNQGTCHYAVRHGVDTAVTAFLVMRAMRKPPDEITSVMAAALTMNVSMLRYHDQLENRCDPLMEKEIQQIRKHPEDSARLLCEIGVDDANWLSYVRLHHENENGSGYPLGKGAGPIPENAKILTIADHYCASVVNRAYRRTLLPNAALRDVLLAGGKPRDPMLAAYFIKELGTYPPGTFVRLQNEEIAVVTETGASPATPIAHALVGPRGVPLSFPLRRDTAKPSFAIREPAGEHQAVLRFSLQQLWGAQAAL